MEFKSIFKNLFIENPDKTMAIAGIFVATILIIFSIFAKNNFLYTIAGFFVLFICLFWLLIRNKVDIALNSNENKIITRILSISFYILLSLAIISIYLSSELYVRPLSYFVIISIIFPVILLEVFYSPKSFTNHLLAQIIIYGLLLEFTELLIFPTSLVGVDPWWHQAFTTMIINVGHIPTGTVYSNLPIFHLEVAMTSILSSLNYKYAAMFSITFLQVFIDSVFTFMIGKRILNDKMGLIAALIVLVANTHISLGIDAIPNTLGPSILLIIIYVLIRSETIKSKLFALLFMIILVLMHTISAFISVLAIFLGFLLSTIYNGYYSSEDTIRHIRNKFSLNIALFFVVFMLGWWLYVSGSINDFAEVFRWGFSVDNFINKPQVFNAAINAIPLLERIFNYLGIYILSSLSLLGCFFMISKNFRNNETFFLAITGLILLAIAFISNFFGTFVVPERWYYFAFVILSIPLAITFVIIFNKINNKALFSFLAFFIAFTLFISPTANVDNHIFDPNSVFTTALSESELTAIYSTGTFWNSTISSDEYYGSVINDYNLSYKGLVMDDNIYYADFTNQSKSLVLIRTRMMTEPIELSGSPYKVDYNADEVLSNERYSQIYDTGSVKGFINLNSINS